MVRFHFAVVLVVDIYVIPLAIILKGDDSERISTDKVQN